jgi:hypothetical protein
VEKKEEHPWWTVLPSIIAPMPGPVPTTKDIIINWVVDKVTKKKK